MNTKIESRTKPDLPKNQSCLTRFSRNIVIEIRKIDKKEEYSKIKERWYNSIGV